jgi:ribokinase
VIITLGERGALALVGDDVIVQPSPRVEVVDSTGAGDAFVAAFAVAEWWSAGIAPALRFACAAGALATTKPGAMPSMPRREDVERLLARDQAPGQRSQACEAKQQ